MAVTLSRPYSGFASGATVILDSATEAALIAQGLASAATGFPAQSNTFLLDSPLGAFTQGGNVSLQQTGGIVVPTVPQGPRTLPNTSIQAFASLGTNATMVAGTLYRAEIQVQHLATWTGIGMLNGTTAGTDNGLVALYDSSGVLIGNSAVAGALSVGANAFQNRAFLVPVTLLPGRYFIAYQQNGATATMRTLSAAMGGNQMTASSTGTFGTIPASFTAPTTFTADVGPIGWLYQ
jgi:hypothetical protein